MPLLIAALLALSAALIVLYPLLGLVREPAAPALAPASPANDAAEREQLARQALREVEFDYTLGNLETGDYEALRERYETRALSALKTRYQREQELDALIERQLDTLRQGESQRTASVSVPATAAPGTAKPAAPRSRRPSAERARPASASNVSVRARRAAKRKES
jgi:hypothetical protein